MTAKRDSKSKPKKDERPKIKRETLSDLEAKGENVKGGLGQLKGNNMGSL